MSNNHTPGPWTITADPLHFHSLTTVIGGKESSQKNGPPQQMIVQVGGFAEWKEAESNARLIASAPELLEALQKCYTALTRYEQDVDDIAPLEHTQMMMQARAAIAKATGGAGIDAMEKYGHAGKISVKRLEEV